MQNYFPPHLLDSENSDKAVTEKAQKAKTILHQVHGRFFKTCIELALLLSQLTGPTDFEHNLYEFVSLSSKFNSSLVLVNSQLVCVLPVGI